MTDQSPFPIRGHVAPGFEPVRDAFIDNFTRGEEQGAGFAAILDGEVVVDLQGGWADRAGTRAWDAGTLVPVYSTTKGIAALVIGGLVDEHAPDGYETKVSTVWPEFAANGKAHVTIGELVSHQAGLPGFAEEIDPALWLDPPACAAALAALPPMWPPGSAHGYHPLTWGYLAGELARRLDPAGRTLGERLSLTMTHTRLADRETETGEMLADFWIGLPASEHARVADVLRPKSLAALGEITPARRAAFTAKWAAPDRGGAAWREIEIPSANGHGTALAVARLYSAWATGGWQGRNHVTLTPEMTRPRYPASPDLVLPMDTSFAAGIMLNTHGLFGPNPQTLGHSGWGGSMATADPATRLATAYVMNRQSSSLVGDPRAVRLVEAAAQCL